MSVQDRNATSQYTMSSSSPQTAVNSRENECDWVWNEIKVEASRDTESELALARILRYASPYPQMLRPAYPQRPLGAVGVIPSLACPPMMAIRGPVVPTIIRPPINTITPAEKPMTTVYVAR
ncbi:unnamed protein product [Lactuca virosa]|uniref:Uncharacterized protein n=1 Tax=Lactuca virosa TaxID=75947 RepID=A0AAU9PSL7_9ASTR|nr:unnamed protein product [Lactuca virosa]